VRAPPPASSRSSPRSTPCSAAASTGCATSTAAKRLAYHAWHPPGRPWNGDLANIYAARAACGLGLIFATRLVPRVGLLDTSFRATDTEYIMRIMAARVD
jgi:hypothetical protein